MMSTMVLLGTYTACSSCSRTSTPLLCRGGVLESYAETLLGSGEDLKSKFDCLEGFVKLALLCTCGVLLYPIRPVPPLYLSKTGVALGVPGTHLVFGLGDVLLALGRFGLALLGEIAITASLAGR